MNIFYLDTDPCLAAQYQCDKHVVKMVLESAQILSNVHHMCGVGLSDKLYKPTHIHHPCVVWASKSKQNYQWLYVHFMSLAQEYTLRYGKTHKSWTKLGKLLGQVPAGITAKAFTPPAQAMPDEYKNPDPVTAYRQYYLGDKAYMFRYTNRSRPDWAL